MRDRQWVENDADEEKDGGELKSSSVFEEKPHLNFVTILHPLSLQQTSIYTSHFSPSNPAQFSNTTLPLSLWEVFEINGIYLMEAWSLFDSKFSC